MYWEKASQLVRQMTLEEKVSQMLHSAKAVDHLGIPAYNWWNEALHGVARSGTATVFPQAIAMAATMDPELIGRVADVIATEGRAKYEAFQEENDRDIYKGLTFWSPNINIFRDPRWGRGHETYGEDPYLTARLGVAFIEHLQGTDSEHLKVAACAKHFAVHSGPESERHEFDAVVDSYDLWNTYLPAFEAAVTEAHVEAVMGAYNRTLHEPCCGSKLLLVDILRNKWKFDGHVTSDCWAIKDFHEHHKVTRTAVESAALAVTMGCDVNCGTVFSYLVEAVNEGLLSEALVDQAVTRLFVSRMRLGLLGSEAYPHVPYSVVDCKEHKELNLEVARRSIVLLKNDGTLPLDWNNLSSVGVIGPNANLRRCLEGNYEGTASEYVTILEGIQRDAQEHGVTVRYSTGCHLYAKKVSGLSMDHDRMSEARIVAKNSDAVIIVLGLTADVEGEEGDVSNEFAGGDKVSLDLIGAQQLLLENVVQAAGGKPVILVLVSGSALSVEFAQSSPGVNAIFQVFYPGSQGGRAVSQAIFGAFSPSGKLPLTFYRSIEDCPDFTDYNMEGRTYRYFHGEALYPFGYGLTYSHFELTHLHASRKTVSVTVTNTGSRFAGETIQVYESSAAEKEIRSLIGFAHVELDPNQSAVVEIQLNPNGFSRYDEHGDLYEVPGEHTLTVGFSQPDERSVSLTKQTPLSITL
jgi:beta-glucosidase